jgi:hypothetical protein
MLSICTMQKTVVSEEGKMSFFADDILRAKTETLTGTAQLPEIRKFFC